jgi:hypothetical protein
MSTIRLVPGNPLALPAEEFADLAQELREAGYEIEIDQVNRQVGYGVTYVEILTIWLPSALALGQAIISGTNWARNRLRKQEQQQLDQDAEEEAKKPPRNRRRKAWKPVLRPKMVRIYGPDGEVLRVLTYSSPDEDPEDNTEEEKN